MTEGDRRLFPLPVIPIVLIAWVVVLLVRFA